MIGPKPREQGFQTGAVIIPNGDESEAEAFATAYVTNEGICLYTALLDQEVEFGRHAFFYAQMGSLDKQAVDADVQDS